MKKVNVIKAIVDDLKRTWSAFMHVDFIVFTFPFITKYIRIIIPIGFWLGNRIVCTPTLGACRAYTSD